MVVSVSGVMVLPFGTWSVCLLSGWRLHLQLLLLVMRRFLLVRLLVRFGGWITVRSARFFCAANFVYAARGVTAPPPVWAG